MSLRLPLAIVVATTALGAGQAGQTFTGVVSDEMCESSHAAMRMGPTDAECTLACHDAHDAAFVLVDDEHVYKLTDQEAPAKFAGQKVTVVGTLDAATRTIRVQSIAPAR